MTPAQDEARAGSGQDAAASRWRMALAALTREERAEWISTSDGRSVAAGLGILARTPVNWSASPALQISESLR